MTLKEIDEQIDALKKQRQELSRQEYDAFVERAKKHIGRCFKIGHTYAKVIGVPGLYSTLYDVTFNMYQFPAIYIGTPNDLDDPNVMLPFYEDNIHSSAWGEGHNPMGNNCEEITNEEFERAFNEALDKFRHQIGV